MSYSAGASGHMGNHFSQSEAPYAAGEEAKARKRDMTVGGSSPLEWHNQRMPEQNDAAQKMFERNSKRRSRDGRER